MKINKKIDMHLLHPLTPFSPNNSKIETELTLIKIQI